MGIAPDRFVWAKNEGSNPTIRYQTTLWLHPELNQWLWQLEVENRGQAPLPLDAVLVQDVGLGSRGFLMNNEAYASQYTDHHIAPHPRFGPVVMSRQNLAQEGSHPWVAHGCFDGAAGFATDAMQLMGPGFRDTGTWPPFGTDLPSLRLQHEVACPMLQSAPVTLPPGATTSLAFFALYVPDHPDASSDADLARLEAVERALADVRPAEVTLEEPVRSIVQDAPPLFADEVDVASLHPDRTQEEHRDGRLLSYFTGEGAESRHVVLAAKERALARRHGQIVRSGQGMLLDEATLCATCWMHGVFAAQLTIGNTSFHKLFSVSRDPYDITRASGLRILVDGGEGWRLLSVPSLFEIGLSDCRWVYRWGERTLAVHAVASGEDAAMQWRVTVEGEPCRLLVLGHLILGERDLDHRSLIEVDAGARRCSFRPDPDWFWGQRYPDAVYHLVTATPEAVDAIGGDELLYLDGQPRNGAYVALRTHPTRELRFAVVGSMTEPAEAARLAAKYAQPVEATTMLAPATAYWRHVTRDLRLVGDSPDLASLSALFPWLAHDAMVHLTVPRGLEQYTGAAWGTRDVCQGPVEFLLSLEHDAPVKAILRTVFAQQYETTGDWPQWFMAEPYSMIQGVLSHGDVIVWPLKALCDYVEATGDTAFLDEPVAWRDLETLERTAHAAPVSAHLDKLLATVRERFIPGTHLIRYGDGDWNDSLQPADPKMRDQLVSAWTVSLLYQQVRRYAGVLRRAERAGEANELEQLADAMRADFNRLLVRDGTVAGYGLFETGRELPELLLHPSDTRTGLRYSLLPITRSIIGGLFTPDQAAHHLGLIREHLLYPDGARLMDRPVAYHGGIERIFRRAESAAFFGREIGIMYVHAHLRYGEAMAALGEADALWQALLVASPIAVTERLAQASPRQRNAYFSSSDAAFPDRYLASAEWAKVKAGEVAVDGGWRIYSSGPGLHTNMLVRHALGLRRDWGRRIVAPLLPADLGPVELRMDLDDGPQRWALGAGPVDGSAGRA